MLKQNRICVLLSCALLTIAHLVGCGVQKITSETKDFRDFTPAQRIEDFAWVTGVFDSTYGLLEYKEKRFNFQWENLKKIYTDRISQGNMTYGEYVNIVHSFVAEMKDAHTSSQSMRDAIINDRKLASLGFFTEREIKDGKNYVKVTKFLQKFFPGKAPIEKDDYILSVNGKDVWEYLKEEITKYRNLGQEESNLTSAATKFAFRSNLSFGVLPTGPVTLKVKRGDQEKEINLEWQHISQENYSKIHAPKDLQEGALRKYISEVKEDGTFVFIEESEPTQKSFNIKPYTTKSFARNQFFGVEEALLERKFATGDKIDGPAKKSNITIDDMEFSLVNTAKGLMAIYRVEDFTESRMKCKEESKIQMGSITLTISSCKIFTGEDYAASFNKLKDLGVKALILDLRHNGGGYLHAGYELARAFTPKSLPVNLAQIRLNEDWVSEFRDVAESPYYSVVERSAFQKEYEILKKDITEKKRMSSNVSIEGMRNLKEVSTPWAGKTYVIVDEMCASMCDIFSGMMQDHKLATIVGKQSMGAGGNVIAASGRSPHAKISLSQTASIMFRLNGSAIENEGTKPEMTYVSTKGDTFWKDFMGKVEASL